MTPSKSVNVALETGRFARRLLGVYANGLLTAMIHLGDSTGLWAALAEGPATSRELAGRAGLQERYVREWLAAVAAARLISYSPISGSFRLEPARAVCLTGNSPFNLAGGSAMVEVGVQNLPRVARAFRRGGGVPYSAYVPDFPRAMDQLNRPRYDALLLSAYLPLAPGLVAGLRRGIRVADVGCGEAHALHLMARGFPRSHFVGIDSQAEPLRRARLEATSWGLTNVRYRRADARRVREEGPFDLITMFDAIHDLGDPAGTLRAVRKALHPRGTLFSVEPRASSELSDNIGRTGAVFLYGISVAYCLPVALAAGNAGLGTAWGVQRAREYFRAAGFRRVSVHGAPANALASVYVVRP